MPSAFSVARLLFKCNAHKFYATLIKATKPNIDSFVIWRRYRENTLTSSCQPWENNLHINWSFNYTFISGSQRQKTFTRSLFEAWTRQWSDVPTILCETAAVFMGRYTKCGLSAFLGTLLTVEEMHSHRLSRLTATRQLSIDDGCSDGWRRHRWTDWYLGLEQCLGEEVVLYTTFRLHVATRIIHRHRLWSCVTTGKSRHATLRTQRLSARRAKGPPTASQSLCTGKNDIQRFTQK